MQLIIQILVALGSVFYLQRMDKMGKARQLRMIQRLLKGLILVGNIWSVLHVLLLMYDIDEPFYEPIFGFSLSGLVLLLMSACILDLCWQWKLSAIYCYIVSECIILQHGGFFGFYVNLVRLVVFGFGLAFVCNIIIQIWEQRHGTRTTRHGKSCM